ncbi:MAG: family 10 glycosylhydrolase [Pseudanabaenaceae cyanobacterium SKYGB_i_bin29]|nr:family 10 glycosylhydrolase [Pseudanabaenaceae cyanobacterium SKYG29]MDW8421186.1 family 10 glycosylhydrolase [Pseudanabaenaceae cyanobacterium SKYGB_i_bin29]
MRRWWLCLLGAWLWGATARAQEFPFCIFDRGAVEQKAQLLQASLNGDNGAQLQYQAIVTAHSDRLQACRASSWLKHHAVWIRLYPCDLKPGKLEQILDNVVNFGYNRLYVNAFYDGRVLLPHNNNPTVFPSVVGEKHPQADLLAEVIKKGRERGIKVYAWVFSLNFGPSYSRRPDRQGALARNGFGETNLQDPNAIPEEAGVAHIFVDPYNPRAQTDFKAVITAIAQRQPDGILFDYIRYPHRTQRITHDVRDLMIYSYVSGTQLLARALSQEGYRLIYDYLKHGKIDRLVPPGTKLWQLPNGQAVVANGNDLNQSLWQLATEHARWGVTNFLAKAIPPTTMTTGAVFFPYGNRNFPEGVDPRLQPWERFTMVQEWHPMLYAACGHTGCIIEELERVWRSVPRGIAVCPALAGFWGTPRGKRLPLEVQLAAIRSHNPYIQCASHFAYSWLDLQSDRERRHCQLP